MRISFLPTLVLALSAPLMAADWRLVWSDEFNGKGAPDETRWTYAEGFSFNNEAQYYTKARPENVRIENGMLVIEARREQFENRFFREGSKLAKDRQKTAEYTSGRLTTEGKESWNHGRVEVRAKLPAGRGTWPAIWMLGANREEAGWPKCGEIDIMEHVGFDPGVIHANIHTQKYNHMKKTNKGDKIVVENPSASFHVYAAEWSTDRMEFFVDGKKYFTYANEKTGIEAWPFDKPFYLILNVAIGGMWGGQKGIDDSIFPQRMEVDYVRVYQ